MLLQELWDWMAISKDNRYFGEGNERLRVINWHKTKCAYEEALTYSSRRAKEPNHQAQYFKKSRPLSSGISIYNVGLGL